MTPVNPSKKSKVGGHTGPTSPNSKHVGGSAFPDGSPVCQPCVPGRRVKPQSGPVHPGFPKPSSAYAKKDPPKLNKNPEVGGEVRVAEQNDDLYRPKRKGATPKKNSPPRRK